MNRRTLRAVAASFLSLAVLIQPIGAADLSLSTVRPLPRGPVASPPRLSPRPQLPVPVSEEPALIDLAARWSSPLLRAYEIYANDMAALRLKGDPDAPKAPPMMIDGARLPKAVMAGLVLAMFFTQVGHIVRISDIHRSRVEGPWRQGRGIRYRINYLDSLGLTWNDAAGLHSFVPYYGRQTEKAAPVPFGTRMATYVSGQGARYEVEIENLSGARLTGLTLWANQEDLDPKGGRGAALQVRKPSTWGECVCVALHKALSALSFSVPGGSYGASRIAALAPGSRITLERYYLEGGGSARINLEQTHLLITARGSPGPETVLANDPQAGIVDPIQ